MTDLIFDETRRGTRERARGAAAGRLRDPSADLPLPICGQSVRFGPRPVPTSHIRHIIVTPTVRINVYLLPCWDAGVRAAGVLSVCNCALHLKVAYELAHMLREGDCDGGRS